MANKLIPDSVTFETRIQNKIDTSAAWEENKHVVLLRGELGIESDTGKFKFGNGSLSWGELPYVNMNLDELLDFIVSHSDHVYRVEKTDKNVSDSELMDNYIAEHNVTPYTGDIFIIQTNIDKIKTESGYSYDGSKWAAMSGNVDVSKVIFYDDIHLSGNYESVGNVKNYDNTGRISSKGKSVQDIFSIIFDDFRQPEAPKNPSIHISLMNGSSQMLSEYECGTVIQPVVHVLYSSGEYQFGPETDASLETLSLTSASGHTVDATNKIFSDHVNPVNMEPTFTLGDGVNYFVQAHGTHGAGVHAFDSHGEPSNPLVAISEGTVTYKTPSVIGYRKMFWGAINKNEAITPDLIRGLTNSKKGEAGSIVISIDSTETKKLVFACESRKIKLVKAEMQSALNIDVTSLFTKLSTVKVAGVDGYAPIDYDVWVYEPAILAGTYKLDIE